jgi:hypothetical protein
MSRAGREVTGAKPTKLRRRNERRKMAMNTRILNPFDRAPDLHEAFYRKVGIPAAVASVWAMAKPVEAQAGAPLDKPRPSPEILLNQGSYGLKRAAWTKGGLSV